MTYSPFNLPLTYSPIKIQFVPPVLITDSDTIDYSDYFIKITPPRSNRPGINYALSESILINIPTDGLLSLQLVPSDQFLPKGRYLVQYYKRGNSTPLDSQHWIVPVKPILSYLSLLYTGQALPLPYNVWSISSVSFAESFVYENNSLVAIGELLKAGITNLTVNYQPALTLDQVIENTVTGV